MSYQMKMQLHVIEINGVNLGQPVPGNNQALTKPLGRLLISNNVPMNKHGGMGMINPIISSPMPMALDGNGAFSFNKEAGKVDTLDNLVDLLRKSTGYEITVAYAPNSGYNHMVFDGRQQVVFEHVLHQPVNFKRTAEGKWVVFNRHTGLYHLALFDFQMPMEFSIVRGNVDTLVKINGMNGETYDVLVDAKGLITDVMQVDGNEWRETVEEFDVLDSNGVFSFIIPANEVEEI